MNICSAQNNLPQRAQGFKKGAVLDHFSWLFKILVWLSIAHQLKSKLLTTVFQPCQADSGPWLCFQLHLLRPLLLKPVSSFQPQGLCIYCSPLCRALPATFPRAPAFSACKPQPKGHLPVCVYPGGPL